MKSVRTYETELPEGYREVKVVDATNKKVSVILSIVTFAITILVIVISALLIRPSSFDKYSLLRNLIFLVAMVAYVVLHELVHGIAYKILTHHKLTFGLTLTVAYCGVPDIYVYRKTAMLSLLAPFTVFTVLFLLLTFFLPGQWNQFYAAFLLALHLGGCSGDLYDTCLYLFRFRDPSTLMRDTGPTQYFYQK